MAIPSLSTKEKHPYPIPTDAPIESGSDHHVLVIDRDNCLLYETDNTQYVGSG